MSKWRSSDAIKGALKEESKDGAVIIDYKGQKGRAAHERKLLKKEAPASEEVVAKLATLQRGILSESKFSAGNVQPTRLRLTGTVDSGVTFVHATGRQVFQAQAPLRLSPDEQANVTLGTQGINISNIVQMKSPSSAPLVEDVLHKAEIQSLAHKDSLVASVDARGVAALYSSSSNAVYVGEDDDDSGSSSRKKLKVSTPRTTGHVLSGDGGTPELGWAGIAFNPLSSQIVTAHSFTKAVRFYDPNTLQTTHVQTSLLMPTALAYSSSSTLVVAEYNQMSLWDVKSHQRIAREGLPSLGCVYAVAWSPDGNSVAIGGEDKIAYIYDTRKWKLRSLWRCPLKYDLSYLSFSPTDPTLCYVAGLDNELMVGKFDGSEKKKDKEAKEYSPTILQMNHRLGFRGDSRWVGVDVVQDNGHDLAVGVCESGSVYSIQPAQHMLG